MLSTPSAIETSIHLFLTTSPFFLLLTYFLFDAHQRPNIQLYQLNEIYDDQIQQEVEEYGIPAIALTDMFLSFLLTMMLWAILAVYVKFFVGRRHRLMEQYKGGKEKGVISVLGNVLYDQPVGRCSNLRLKCHNDDYAYVTYEYPTDDNAKPKEQPQQPPAHFTTTDLKATTEVGYYTNLNVESDTNTPKLIVEKKIRTYYPYHRERITILLLPDLPLSGQPQADIERDLASYTSTYASQKRNRMHNVFLLCLLWIVFCISGAIYILHQMDVLAAIDQGDYEYIENEWLMENGWNLFMVWSLGLVPVVSAGGNVVRWWWYYRWVTDRGVVTAHVSKVVPRVGAEEDVEVYNEEVAVICDISCEDVGCRR